MAILAVDTATPAVTVAVVDPAGAVLAERRVVAANRHGELLAGLIAEALAAAGLRAGDLTALAAGTGPGPFTGLRVGVVTAAVLAEVLGRPTYSFCSLDAFAGRDVVVVTDARRREVYWAGYDAAGRRTDGPQVCRPAEVPLGGRPAVGPAVELYPDVLAGRPDWPRAAVLGAAAAARLAAGEPGEPLVPRYLRRPDARPPGPPKPVLPARAAAPGPPR